MLSVVATCTIASWIWGQLTQLADKTITFHRSYSTRAIGVRKRRGFAKYVILNGMGIAGNRVAWRFLSRHDVLVEKKEERGGGLM